jgi:hypothetical protein
MAPSHVIHTEFEFLYCSSKDTKRKDSLDPMKTMKKYLESKETHGKHKKHRKEHKHRDTKKDKVCDD